jgi:hypothetical protein
MEDTFNDDNEKRKLAKQKGFKCELVLREVPESITLELWQTV